MKTTLEKLRQKLAAMPANELRDLVFNVTAIAFLTTEGEEAVQILDSDKECEGGDTVEALCEELNAAGLHPEKLKAFKPTNRDNPQSSITEEEEMRRGSMIAEVCQLKASRDYPDRFFTTWGTKSPIGLFRSIQRIVEDGK